MGRVVRLSISVAPDLDERLREAAARAGQPISAWVADAIEDRLERELHFRAVEDRLRQHDEFFGPVPEEIARQVDEEMLRLGIIDPADIR
jgi:predicted transcriptional regulator